MLSAKPLIFSTINLMLLGGAAYFLLKEPLIRRIKKRRERFQIKKNTAEEMYENAGIDYDQLYGQMKNIQQEMKDSIEEAAVEGEKEGEKHLLNIEKIADRLISESMARADSEIKKIKKSFHKEVIEKSLKKAEEMLKQEMTRGKEVELIKLFLNDCLF